MKNLLLILFLIPYISQAQEAVVKEWRTLSEFHSVVMTGPFELYIIQEDIPEFYIEAEENILRDIETRVNAQTLYINLLENHKFTNTFPVKIYMHTPELKKIKMTGNGLIKTKGLKTDQLEIEMYGTGTINIDELLTEFLQTKASGSGKIELDVWAQQIRVSVNGTGKVDLKGNCRKSELNLNGTGEINTSGLHSLNCQARIIGTGNIYVSASDTVKAEIIGTGNIYCSGDAEITLNSIGTGKIIKKYAE